MSTIKHAQSTSPVTLEKQRSYGEVIEFFDAHWSVSCEKSLERAKALDAAFGDNAKKLAAIFIGGSSGKSLTAHFTAKLLKEEGLAAGVFYAPHILTYNERFSLNGETISNKALTDLANEVINQAESLKIKFNSYELLAQIAFNYFTQQKVDVVIFEVNSDTAAQSLSLLTPKVYCITRLVDAIGNTACKATDAMLNYFTKHIAAKNYIVSADQNKENLKNLQNYTLTHGAHWEMPIRKLVPLSYPFEQLHGRSAALAERVASIFVHNFTAKNTVLIGDSLLIHQKAQRGRPTLEAKRNKELHQVKTLSSFWKETLADLPARFQLFDKEKPSILLDVADDVDALKNTLLGIRLLNYQKPLKGLTLIMGCYKNAIDTKEYARVLRYFFKKNSGIILLCPIKKMHEHQEESWNVQDVYAELSARKVKAKSCESFKEAFELAKKSVDERQGLVVIVGAPSFINEYWNYKGIKKF